MAVIKNVILDWSGTLVNDLPPVVEATNEIFQQYGRPAFSEQEFREKFFLPFPEFYKVHLPEATMVQLDHYYHSVFKLLQENIPLLPHAAEFLTYCQRQGMPIFLLSSIHAEHFDVQGERLGVKHFFKQAYVQAIDKRKTILNILAEHDLEPGETLLVGDMQHDIETARHGGVVSCAVLTGYNTLEMLQQANPDLLFKDLRSLQEYLERHQKEPDLHPIATVGALIFNEKNEVLMIQTHKWSNKWGIPGGKIKGNETAVAALQREMREETGLEVSDIEFVMVQDCIQSTEFYKKAHFVLLNYTCRTTQTEVTLNEEAEQYQWRPIDKALELPLNEPTKILINYVRSHSD